MANTGFKILAKFCQEKDVTDAHKEGILLGMHIMALQTEKWLDNEGHSTAYRMDTWDECGFSGWREIYQHTKGFLEAEQPEEDVESDVSDMELTDDEEGMTWEQLKEEMKTNLNETVSDENDEFEVVDKEDEESEDDEEDFTPYTYENVEYLIAPKYDDPERVVLETEDYHPVGVFEDGKIVFEDNLQVANHYDRVRESTIPEDTEEAYDLLKCFIEDNYTELSSRKFYNTIQVFRNSDAGRTERVHGCQLPIKRHTLYLHPQQEFHVLGKNMGEVMKQIEALLQKKINCLNVINII